MQPAAARRPPGRFSIRPLIATVYLPTFFVAVGQGAVLPFIPLFARDLGAGLGLAGLVFAMRGFGTMVFDVPAGVAVSRFGERRTLLVGAGSIVIVGIGSALSTSVLQLGAFVFLFGAGNAVFQISRLAYISEIAPVQHRGRAIALIGGTNRVGMFVGPLIGGLLAKGWGIPAVFVLQSATGLIATATIFVLVREVAGSRPPAGADGGHGLSARITATLVEHRRSFLTWGLAVVMLQVIRTGRQILLPLWGDEIGLDEAAIGAVFGLSSGIDMLLFYPVGFVMDRWGRKWTGVPSLLVLSVGLALIPFTHSLELLLLVGVLTGLGSGLGTGIVMTLGADLSPPGARGEFLGVWRLIGDIGTASGPFVIGAIAQVLTLSLASLVAAGMGLAGAAVMILAAVETLTREEPPAADGGQEHPSEAT